MCSPLRITASFRKGHTIGSVLLEIDVIAQLTTQQLHWCWTQTTKVGSCYCTVSALHAHAPLNSQLDPLHPVTHKLIVTLLRYGLGQNATYSLNDRIMMHRDFSSLVWLSRHADHRLSAPLQCRPCTSHPSGLSLDMLTYSFI